MMTVAVLTCAAAHAVAAGSGAPAPSPPAAAAGAPASAAAQKPQVLVGPVTRAQVEAAAPAWVKAGVEARPDVAAVQALAAVPPGAEVTVLLGTWCGDSRREISRLWRAFDLTGAGVATGAVPAVGAAGSAGGTSGLPFSLTYIAVDEAKRQPAAAVTAAGLRFVPTLIVRRDGREVGRIVESSPHGVEVDLLALLDGKASGLLTSNPELLAQGAEGKAAPGAASPAPPPHPPNPLNDR
jgi:hypothetical protein